MYTYTFSYEGQCDEIFTKQRRHHYVNSGNHCLYETDKHYDGYSIHKMFDKKKTGLQSVKAEEMSKPGLWCLGFEGSDIRDTAIDLRFHSYQQTQSVVTGSVSQPLIHHITALFTSLYIYNSDSVFLHSHVVILQLLQDMPY
jgi:hypothetical protein